jgi:hypothetical protein
MPEELEPTRPIDVYKAIIDQLVSETSHGLSERLLAEGRHLLESAGPSEF